MKWIIYLIIMYLIIHNFSQSHWPSRCECFCPNWFGYQAIFFHKVNKHVPLATIIQWIGQKKHHQTSIWFFSFPCEFFISIYEKICPFDSVPEVEILLAKFKVFQVEILDKLLTNCIQKCKNPTPSRCFLVCNRFNFINLREYFNIWLNVLSTQDQLWTWTRPKTPSEITLKPKT